MVWGTRHVQKTPPERVVVGRGVDELAAVRALAAALTNDKGAVGLQ